MSFLFIVMHNIGVNDLTNKTTHQAQNLKSHFLRRKIKQFFLIVK